MTTSRNRGLVSTGAAIPERTWELLEACARALKGMREIFLGYRDRQLTPAKDIEQINKLLRQLRDDVEQNLAYRPTSPLLRQFESGLKSLDQETQAELADLLNPLHPRIPACWSQLCRAIQDGVFNGMVGKIARRNSRPGRRSKNGDRFGGGQVKMVLWNAYVKVLAKSEDWCARKDRRENWEGLFYINVRKEIELELNAILYGNRTKTPDKLTTATHFRSVLEFKRNSSKSIRIELKDGTRVDGTLTEVSDDQIWVELLTSGKSRQVPETRVAIVECINIADIHKAKRLISSKNANGKLRTGELDVDLHSSNYDVIDEVEAKERVDMAISELSAWDQKTIHLLLENTIDEIREYFGSEKKMKTSIIRARNNLQQRLKTMKQRINVFG